MDRDMLWTARMDSRISGDVVSLEYLSDTGEMVQKYIRFSDFRAIINNCSENENLVHIGRLPRGYYDGRLSAMGEGTFHCSLVVPAGRKTIRYYNTIYEVPYPATVFAFYSEAGRLNNGKVFFINTDQPTEQTVLYQYCFANVSSGKGEICWGANQLPTLSSMEDCNRLVALFFGSPCNDDYYSYSRFAVGAPEYCKSQRALYEYIKTCEAFPFEILAATSYRMEDLLT